MKLPKITISGEAHTGKTAIAMIIAKALQEAGIPVTLRNEDTDPQHLVSGQEARLAGLKQHLKGQPQSIVIDTLYGGLPDARLVTHPARAFIELNLTQPQAKHRAGA